MYEIETRKREAKNFFAGDFKTLTDCGVAGAEIKEYMPVVENASGKIVPVTVPEENKELEVIGIAATDAEADDPIVYYITGEYFADALVLPEGIEIAVLKKALRKLSIFLR